MKIASFAFASFLVVAPAWSAGVDMREGLWEITTGTDMASVPGMPKGMKMPVVTVKYCYSADEVRGNKAMMPEKSNCKVTRMQQSGKSASWSAECQGEQAMRLDGEGSFSGDSYTIKSRMTFLNGQMKGQSMSSTINAKRIGDCKK